jgi:hypothetical protein
MPHQVDACALALCVGTAQGDELAAAACGLTTGYPQGQPAGASNSAQQQGSDWPFAARGLSSQDVDAVEQHMLQLVQLPGVSAADTGSIAADGGRGPAIERQLHQAELKVGTDDDESRLTCCCWLLCAGLTASVQLYWSTRPAHGSTIDRAALLNMSLDPGASCISLSCRASATECTVALFGGHSF